MLIACATARRLFRRQSAAWLVLLLTAVAPLSFCVTHFATGDIGVDLFGGLALLLLVLFARRPAFMLAFAAGAATGIAFGCKYNGILCGLAIAIYALLHLVSRWRIGTFLATSAASLGGCVVGIVASTPALLIDFKRTRDDIFANFQFIKDYSVPDEERALPFLQKAWLGLTRNTADIVGSLGWVVMFLAAVGLVATIVSYARRPKHGDFESNQNTVLRARLAVILFPFIALFMSLAGKLEVQPFHFSYLQVPFVLAAAAGVVALGRGAWRGARLLAGFAAAAAVVEFGLDAAYERFYWQREDNVTFVNEFPSKVIAERWYNAGSILRDTTLEGRNVSAFRNRKTYARSPRADVWKQIACSPVPCVPYPGVHDWIFMNGPLFPRNDRMVQVGGHRRVERHLVFRSSPPAELSVGLRSMAWPVRVTLDVGGERAVVNLMPNKQELVALRPKRRRTSRQRADGTRAYLVPVSIRTEGGGVAPADETTGVTATFFANETERARFALFGGTAEPPLNLLPEGVADSNLVQAVDGALYVGTQASGLELIAESQSRRQRRLPEKGTLLPCGRYVLEVDVTVLSDEAKLSFSIGDPRAVSAGEAQVIGVQSLTRGGRQLEYAFGKPFAPHLCQASVECNQGVCRLNCWRIVPDTAELVGELRWLSASGQLPSWSRRFAAGEELADQPEQAAPGMDVVFDDAVRLTRFALPSVATNGRPLRVGCDVDLLDFAYAAFDEAAFFIHLMDTEGGMVSAFGFTLRDAAIASETGRGVAAALSAEVSPGTYAVQIGMWNARTHQRLPPEGESLSSLERRKERIELGTITVAAGSGS